mmetsp:Transcript_18180/g.45846  ORF Transcript_18180/g.45846 Transcript_18180/m.45846 type:complete len:207 (-) Transcript_18180:694-1314(-)
MRGMVGAPARLTLAEAEARSAALAAWLGARLSDMRVGSEAGCTMVDSYVIFISDISLEMPRSLMAPISSAATRRDAVSAAIATTSGPAMMAAADAPQSFCSPPSPPSKAKLGHSMTGGADRSIEGAGESPYTGADGAAGMVGAAGVVPTAPPLAGLGELPVVVLAPVAPAVMAPARDAPGEEVVGLSPSPPCLSPACIALPPAPPA